MQHTRITWYLLAVMAALTTPTLAEEQAPRTISVSGEGHAAAPPDMATIQTGVVTQAEKARDALEANNAAMDGIMTALKSQKIKAKDIQTSSFDVRPEYKRGPRGQQQPEIVGYRVTNQVQIQVHNLPDLGAVLDAVIAAGSNQISAIRFGIDDPTDLLNQARNRAISDAQSRADLYAQAASVRVGQVITIREQSVEVPRPQHMGYGMTAKASSTVPIATGEQQLRATVHMVFALKDKN
jgi:uncharacterized protein YggE